MCHQSPTVVSFGALISTVSLVFHAVHIWQYDRGRCMIFTRKDVFRWVMVWILLFAVLGFTAYTYIQTYIKYQVGYGYVPNYGLMPEPYQFWPHTYVTLWKASYWLLILAWVSLICIHLEEFLYWEYMLRACGQSTVSWFRSIYFKLWLGGSFVGAGAMIASTATGQNLQDMETHLYLCGSIISLFLVTGSWYICWKFPQFIALTRRLNANQDVLSRLLYMKVLNQVRTLFRTMYAFILFTLSIDGVTKAKRINSSHLATDAFFILSFFFVFASTALALLVMLPKAQGMSTQKQQAITHRPLPVTPTTRSALPSPSNAVGQATAWSVIGDRLNIDQNQISELVPRTEYDLDGLAPISKNDRKTSPRSPAMYADPRGLARAESTIVSLS